MTQNVYNGSDLRIFLDDNKVYHATSCNLDFTIGTKERATKDTVGTEVSLDKETWSVSGDGLAVPALPTGVTASYNFEALYDAKTARQLIPVKFSLGPAGETGDTFYEGQAYLTALNISSNVDEDATCSFTLTGNGLTTKSVLA